MRKENYLIEIQQNEKDTAKDFMTLLANENKRFKLVNVEWIQIKEVKQIAGRTFVHIESDFTFDDLLIGKTGILFENEFLSDPLNLVYEIYDEFQAFKNRENKDLVKKTEDDLGDFDFYEDRDLELLYLIKSYLYDERKFEENPLSKEFLDFLNTKQKITNVRLLKFYKEFGRFPTIDYILKGVMPKYFEDLKAVRISWHNIISSFKLNVAVKNLKNNQNELQVPKFGYDSNEEVF